MLGGQALANRLERLLRHAFPQPDPRHDAHALAFDEDLPFRAFFGSHFAAQGVVGAQEPLAVPSMLAHGFLHPLRLRAVAFGVAAAVARVRNIRHLPRRKNE